jgi:RND family efflux transporter MFP subunit
MKIRKSIWIVLIVLISIGGVYYQLKKNKKELNSEITFAARQIDAIPVKVEPTIKSIINSKIKASGTLEANSQLMVVSETQGKIIHLNKNLGDFVQKGEVIAKVEDETLTASVMVAEANIEQQEKDVERFKRMSEGDAITKHDLEKAEIGLKKAKADLINAQKALSNTSITASIPGVINQKFVTEGQFLSGGMPVCEIVDNNQLKLHVKIDGNDIYKIKKYQDVNVSVPGFSNQTFPGKVTAVAVKADQSMNFNVEITLNDTGGSELKSGHYAEVEFPVQLIDCLIIRKESISGSMEKPQVFVVENSKAVLKNIITGISNDKYIEVISGLSEGEKVIYSGQLNLSGNEQVKIIE